MISVCIPVYNFNVICLAKELSRQLAVNPVSAEILFLDDGSNEAFRAVNQEIKNLPGVKYYEQNNVGRSGTRNKLAELAQGENLIFIDADCYVPDDYLIRYSEQKNPGAVVVGGIDYPPKPFDKMQHLRWKVGVKREMRNPGQRQKHAYKSFLSSNFMISAELYKRQQFNQQLEGYGHEDTLYGMALYAANIPIIHIYNPVIHNGIDRADVYLEKLNESVKNLARIIEMNIDANSIKLIRHFKIVRRLRLSKLSACVFKRIKPSLHNYFLKGGNSLFLLDIYKIGLLCCMDK